MERTKLSNRKLPNYSMGEEIANMTTHIVGGAFGIAATVLCVVVAASHHSVYGVVSGSIYGAMMIILYSMSSIYHGLSPQCFGKRVLQVLDHCSVYLLIAGTYTPILLCSIRPVSPVTAWVLFGVVWAAAIVGITLTAIDLNAFKVFSLICYLAMGWCIIFATRQAVQALTVRGFALLLLGGVSYTVGAGLYVAGRKRKYFHSVFHVFVLVGSLLHFFCILFFVL